MINIEEVKELLDKNSDNIICDKFCLLPSRITNYIDTITNKNEEYGYIIIGAEKSENGYYINGLNRSANLHGIFMSAVKKVKAKTEIEQKVCAINGKKVWVIKVKTCKLIEVRSAKEKVIKDKILENLYSACIKLQANSMYYSATEDQRNDYIRDMMDSPEYEVRDQTRRGLSPNGKAAGELDIFVRVNSIPVTVIEALNLKSLNTAYLDMHIDKLFNYDTAGTAFNVILSYVMVKNFEEFCNKYLEHIREYNYQYSLMDIEEHYSVNGSVLSDIRMMLTKHNRNGIETSLIHICVRIGKK